MNATLGACPGDSWTDLMADLYLATDGNDGNAGTLGAPWGTLPVALSRLSPGDTLWVRGGRYFNSNLNPPSGTAGNPITIRAYPGEEPIVDCAMSSSFRTPGNSDWEVHDAGRHIWRSVTTVGNPGPLTGRIAYAGDLVQLWPAPSLAYLSSDEHRYVPNINRYLGPGITWNSGDSRIYIRLEKPDPSTQLGLTFPELPDDPDPRAHAIYVSPQRLCWQPGNDRRYIIIDGINGEFAYRYLRGVPIDWTVRNVRAICNRSFMALDNLAGNILVEWCTIDVRPMPHLFMTDAKGDPLEPASQQHTNAFGIANGAHDIEIRHNQISEAFDGLLVIGGTTVTDISVHHNQFELCWDDGVQLGSGTSRFEYHHNFCGGAGISHHGSGAATDPGTKWFHHNVFDNATLLRWSREDAGSSLEPARDGWQYPVMFGVHSSGANDQPDPWKFYNNTVVVATPRGITPVIGLEAWVPFGSAGTPQEIFNNIILHVADGNGVGLRAIDGSRIPEYNEVWDGNLYYSIPNWKNGEIARIRDINYIEQYFMTLADFKASAHWPATQAGYAPGWENSGIEGLNPQLDGGYRPQAAGVHTSAVDLSGRGWPGVNGIYRGAIGTDQGGAAVEMSSSIVAGVKGATTTSDYPAEDVAVSKAVMRENLAAAKAEIDHGGFVVDPTTGSTEQGSTALAHLWEKIRVEALTGRIDVVENRAYPLDEYAAYPYEVNALAIRAAAGTCTARLTIDGVAVTGISAVPVGSGATPTVANASAANAVAAGGKLELVLSANAGALQVSFTVKRART